MSKEQSPVKIIIFDLGNVLVGYDMRRAANEFSRTCDVSVLQLWQHFILSPYEKAYARGEMSCEQFYEEARKALDLKIDFETFRLHWNGIFWENEGMEDLLIGLKENYALYLLSNTNQMHFEHIKQHYPMLRHFRGLYASHELGLVKPDTRIYETVLEKIGAEASTCLFIDDQKDFVEGARKAGLAGLQFKNRAELINDLRNMGLDFKLPAGKAGREA